MYRFIVYVMLAVSILLLFPFSSSAVDIDEIFDAVQGEISGNRARDYVMRLWMYDKWSTLPGWQKSVNEAQEIMSERGYDEAVIHEVPADGVSKSGDWVHPVGWDVKQATLEVIEPSNLPNEFRYLCNYQNNPTSLNAWSAPTPPDGIETELVLMETRNPDELARLNARGKIVLTAGGTRGMKRYLDRYGILGFAGDNIESNNVDFVNANQWLNGWSDLPGGWWFTDYDSRNNFGFSLSQKKANYLRNLLRQGRTIKVRAKIDSRYYTDDTLPYVTGLVKGSGAAGEEVLITGHLNEWGANDNATGCSAIMEAVGTLNDLITSGILPRPERSIRVLLGAEMYGSLPYVEANLERLSKKTIAAVCCDTPAADYDLATTAVRIGMNPNVCPTFTDAVFPEIVRQYYVRYAPERLWRMMPFSQGTDTYFCDPMIGVPTNYISFNNGGHLHHNSMDTIDKVDPCTLRELSFLNAVYLYYVASAGQDEIPFIAQKTFDRGIQVILDETGKATGKIMNVKDGTLLGSALAEGIERIEYYTGLEIDAVKSIVRLAPTDQREKVQNELKRYTTSLDDYGTSMIEHIRNLAKDRARMASIKIVMPKKTVGEWEKEAEKIVPRRRYFATLFLADVPVEKWEEVRSSPHWWSRTNWASASYWWCDGKRNLNEIKRLVELEASRPISNFDLINYYTFLKEIERVDF